MGRKKIIGRKENGPVWPQQQVSLHEVGTKLKTICISIYNKVSIYRYDNKKFE
jgi:hypothetical protein